MIFITAKFHQILLRGFKGVAMTKKIGLTDLRTDCMTDGRVKNIIVAWGIIKLNSKIHLCHSS